MKVVAVTLIVLFSTCLFAVLSRPLHQIKPSVDLLLDNNIIVNISQQSGLDSSTIESSRSAEKKLNKRNISTSKEKDDKKEKIKGGHQSSKLNDQELKKLILKFKPNSNCKGGCSDPLFDPRLGSGYNPGKGGSEF